MKLNVPIQRLPHMVSTSGKNMDLPFYATEQSAGMDLMAAIPEDIVINPSEIKIVPTGVAIALPEGHEAQIRSRSGLSSKGVVVLNAPGTIDADYRGEIKIILCNHSQASFTVTRAMRIAQLVVAPFSRVVWQEQEDLSDTKRVSGGFGSTSV